MAHWLFNRYTDKNWKTNIIGGISNESPDTSKLKLIVLIINILHPCDSNVMGY
ncbi:hypothetical protein [Epilithonimonas tenax]|uniref:hypothetical protein n=1 Tax=Epilithonimonas tenax TaxID=191577 RepID=UPI0012B591D1|nr:hypothetical protein [Epilithonimonas tenax]